MQPVSSVVPALLLAQIVKIKQTTAFLAMVMETGIMSTEAVALKSAQCKLLQI